MKAFVVALVLAFAAISSAGIVAPVAYSSYYSSPYVSRAVVSPYYSPYVASPYVSSYVAAPSVYSGAYYSPYGAYTLLKK